MPIQQTALDEFCSMLNLLQPISGELENYILNNLEVKILKKHKRIISCGDKDSRIWYVVSGTLRAYFPCETFDEVDTEHTTKLMSEGKFVISTIGFFSNEPSFENVETVSESVLIKISKSNWLEMHRLFPEIYFHSHAIFQEYFVLIGIREFMLRQNDAKKRFQILNKYFPDLQNQFSEKYLASFAAMSRGTFSSLKNGNYNMRTGKAK